MQVVRLDWFSRVDGNRVEWFTSRAAARLRADELEWADEIIGDAHVAKIDLPTTNKPAMLAWLNAHLRSHNV